MAMKSFHSYGENLHRDLVDKMEFEGMELAVVWIVENEQDHEA